MRLIADCEVEILEPEAPAVPELPARRDRPNGPAPAQGDEPRMTEPQKRYLFRLLAQQGTEAKQAEAHLKNYFRVQNLRDVSKAGASQLIEELIADQKEASGGAA
ncbi:MAG: hypothetical protein HY294_06555 [Candidatus Rokubacteria bacterium]|nr:hypothetical protein [Candidatus Rokubacteria bacterium]